MRSAADVARVALTALAAVVALAAAYVAYRVLVWPAFLVLVAVVVGIVLLVRRRRP